MTEPVLDGHAVSAPAHETPADTDWRDALPDDLRPAAAKFNTVADVVKSYAALETRLGASVTVPGEGASEKEIAAYHKRLGRPDAPDDYALTLPDGLPDHLKPGDDAAAGQREFLAAMHKAGATPETVQAAYGWYYETLNAADQAQSAAAAQARADAEATLRRDWGAAYDANLKSARTTARRFGGDRFVERLEAAGLADDPVCLKTLAKIGGALGEDRLHAGPGSAEGDVRGRIDRLTRDHFGKKSYYSPAVQSELRGLYAELYGTGR